MLEHANDLCHRMRDIIISIIPVKIHSFVFQRVNFYYVNREIMRMRWEAFFLYTVF